jgi:hypothetical protein
VLGVVSFLFLTEGYHYLSPTLNCLLPPAFLGPKVYSVPSTSWHLSLAFELWFPSQLAVSHCTSCFKCHIHF